MISSETVAGNEVMVSFNVKSLFINVPVADLGGFEGRIVWAYLI